MDSPSQTANTPETPSSGAVSKASGGGLAYAAALARGSFESALFLAPLAFIFDLAGYISPDLRLFFIYACLAAPLCRMRKPAILKGASALLAVMALKAFTVIPDPAEILLLVFAHLWIWSLAGVASRPIVQGLIAYTLIHLCLFASPLGYPVQEFLAGTVRTTNRWVTGATLNLGYTYAGIGSLLLFLCLSLHAWEKGLVSKLRTGAFLVVGLLISAFAAAVLLYKVNLAPDLTWEMKFRDSYTLKELAGQLKNLVLLVYPLFVFAAHAVGYVFLHHDVRKSNEPAAEADSFNPWGRMTRAYAGFAAGALVLLLFAIPPTSFRIPSPSRLVFINGSLTNDNTPGGRRGVVSFTKPDYTRYGRAAGGMFGFFPEYASLFGCPGEVVDELPETLDPNQILVITNLDEPTLREEMERIWSFVRAGGKLWILGDHTFIKNGRNHINDLLEPCHIRFNHDSAQFWPQGWFHSYRMREGTPFAALEDPAENRLSLLVGASLELHPPARPLVQGRFGYGDWGSESDEDDQGYLGDFKYQATERCGDLVLVAGERVGKGKVLVFGDTTSFFNANISRSYEILRASLSWFGEAPRYSFFFSRAAGIALVLGVAGLVLLSLRSRPAASPLVLLLVAAVSWIAHRPGLLPVDPEVGRSRLALFDFAHQPYAAKHGSLGEGLYGLSLSFLRYDLLPVTQNRWDRELIENARILVLNAPRKPFSAARQREITRFMERGGTVLLACGAHQYRNCRRLLDPLQLKIRNLPLGRFFDRPAFNQPIQYFSAWPIQVGHPQATVLSLYGDWPLMVDVPVGSGRLVLIADSEFLLNKNMESHEQYSVQNIQFVRNLLDFVSSARPVPEEPPSP